MINHHRRMVKKNTFKNKSLLVLGVASFLWFIFRTGTKPSRIVYPCQRVALANGSMLLGITIPLSLTTVLTKTKKFSSKKGTTLALLIILAIVVISSEQFWGSLQLAGAVDPNQEIQLTLDPRNATAFPASDIYLVNGPAYAHINELVDLMGLHGLFFYKSGTIGGNQGPDGLIARDDVVLIKINCQWNKRGGTNTDLLKELIQMIVDHPDGFIGEIVVADNGQAQYGSFQNGGSLNWTNNNAEDHSQSAQDVVDMFSVSYNVSTYLWDTITLESVAEYSEGDMNDGYIVNQTANPVTGIKVSYPKFKTKFGTYVSFKKGIWDPVTQSYESQKLKVINFPVLKSHSGYGVTASMKHYMGVGSAKQTNAHAKVATGGMGTEMVETRFPTLNILDAIWVNANPAPSSSCGPSTPYGAATRVNVVMASTDPVALAYWGSKHVLVQAAESIGYTDTHTINPDNTDPGGVWGEAFGIWLNLTKDEIIAGGYNATNDENHMSVHVYPQATHDIAVIDVVTSETVVAEGSSLNISVTTQNQGDFNEDFNLSIYANTTAIQTKVETLPSKNSTTTNFTWNTTGFANGNYTINATATVLESTNNPDGIDNDPADNTLDDITVFVTIPGDIDGDGDVDFDDFYVFTEYYPTPSPNKVGDPRVDLDNDGDCDFTDFWIFTGHYPTL